MNVNFRTTLKLLKSDPQLSDLFICFNDSPSTMMKNAF